MAYRVEISRRVGKALARFPRVDQARILAAIQRLADEPRPHGCVPVRGTPRDTLRIRVGEYRVVYTILEAESVILVSRVARRSESTYRELE